MATITLTVGTGTQQWVPPYGCVTLDKIELWGPGGSGGKRAGRSTGGGAGAYNFINGPISVASLLVAGTVAYQTGRGGAAVSTASTNGNPGTAKTWFSAIGTYAADFGMGGRTANNGTVAGGAGGLVANCVPTTNGVAGGNGGTCSSASGASGGGASGSGAGAGVTAGAVSTGVAGAGATAPSGGGNGGAASITAVNATAGTAPGGGGGGLNQGAGAITSGAGADGRIILTYTPSFGLSDTLTTADTNAVTTTITPSVSETGNAVDTLRGIAAFAISEAGTADDAVDATTITAYAISVSETGTAADTISGFAIYSVSVAEIAAAASTVSAVGISDVSVEEAGSAVDTDIVVVQPPGFFVDVAEIESAADAISIVFDPDFDVVESGSATDTISVIIVSAIEISVTETGSPVDMISVTGVLPPIPVPVQRVLAGRQWWVVNA